MDHHWKLELWMGDDLEVLQVNCVLIDKAGKLLEVYVVPLEPGNTVSALVAKILGALDAPLPAKMRLFDSP